MPNLIVERGKEKGSTIELKSGVPCVAGRDPAAVTVVLSDPAASRRHFQVVDRGGRWYVSDLASKNHTYLNEEKLEKEVELTTGDRIQVGETVLSFLDEDKADKTAAQGLNGKEIGGYLILDRIGRGGMGTVFKAKQKSLNRVVALKVLASKFAKDPKFVEKFQSEARAAGQLNHPHVVQVFDVGQAGGLHFFSMEFMEGGCVQDLLSARPDQRLPWQEALPLIVDATRGLVFAEKRGIIHRDIKPDNLMLTSEMRAKVGDLGLAKSAEEVGGDKAIFGTPHFIAPEQAQGKEVTHAADIYALGATFYRIVAGTTPFTGETVKEILRKQINDTPKPVTEIVPDFPPDLAAILDKMMAKRVEDRYQSATRLLEDLESFELAHQIELSGARKLNKPLMYAASAFALVGVAVAIYFIFIKPADVKEVKTVVDRPVYIKETPTGTVLTPEQEAAQKLQDAKIDRLEVRDKERPLGTEISLEKKVEWLQVADAYDQVVQKHSDPRAAKETELATARANEIRTRIDLLDKERTALENADRDWWRTTSEAIQKLEQERNWPEAIRLAKKQLADPEARKRMSRLRGVHDELSKVEERENAAAKKGLDDLLAFAKAAIDQGGDFRENVGKVQKWADELEAFRPESDVLNGLVLDARNWVTDRRGEVQDRLTEQLEQDRAAYVDAVRALRQGGSGSGLVFDYQFGAAAQQFESACAVLRTHPYQDRAAAKVRRLREAQGAWEKWLQLLGEGRLFAAGEEIKGLPGAAAGVKYTLNLDDKPTPDRFMTDSVMPGVRGKKPFTWADLTREELFAVLVSPKLDKLPSDVALGLSWLFCELGHGAAAAALLDRATGAGAQIAADEETALRRETATVKGYDAVRQKVGGDPNEIVNAVMQWRQTFAGTDAWVLLDGRVAKDLPIFTEEEVRRFLDGLGVRPPK